MHLDERDSLAVEERAVHAARLDDRVDDLPNHRVLEVGLEPADDQFGMSGPETGWPETVRWLRGLRCGR
jgi:hypothetical protein